MFKVIKALGSITTAFMSKTMGEISSENELATIQEEKGILIMTVRIENVDLIAAKKLVEYRINTIKEKKFPTIINISNLKTMSKEARDYLAGERASEGVTAAVILMNSKIESMIGNFFLRISKPAIPTKLYTEETEAKKWLSQFCD